MKMSYLLYLCRLDFSHILTKKILPIQFEHSGRDKSFKQIWNEFFFFFWRF